MTPVPAAPVADASRLPRRARGRWLLRQPQPRTAPLDAVAETRWVFVLLCCYLASQAYTVAILPVGPWAVWPGLPDVVFGALVAAWFFVPRPATELSGIRRTAVQAILGLTIACILSYVTFTLLASNLETVSFGSGQQGPAFGLFEAVRLVQFLILFRIAAGIPYTPGRLAVITRVVTAALIFVCVTVILTFIRIIPSAAFSPLLPNDRETAGAWWQYVNNYDEFGLGAISYTHAYVAAQVALLLGLALHLRGHQRWAGNGLLIVLALAAALVSGSRAGFAGVLLMAAVFLLARSPRWLVSFALALALVGAAAFLYVSSQPPVEGDPGLLGSIVDRQADAFQPFEEDNLVGRNEIWAGRIAALNAEPWRWFTGWGFGSAPDTGPALNPHLLPLQVIVELGFGMLLLIALAGARLMRDLWRRESFDRPFFWTTIALLLSSATQETFYPVPAMGYFLGFYLVALAIVQRAQTDPIAIAPTPAARASRPAMARQPHAATLGTGASASG